MKENSIYWFIKFYTNFFETNEIDYLLDLKNGEKYVLFYIMLCLNTANSNGELKSVMGKKVVPHSNTKLLRDSKRIFNTESEIETALKILLDIDLLTKTDESFYQVKDHFKMVGKITQRALEKQASKHIKEDVSKVKHQFDNKKIYLESETNNDLFIQYLEMRLVENIDTNEKIINNLIERLNEYGSTDEEKKTILNRALERKWNTFFPIENKKESKSIDISGYDTTVGEV